MKQFTTGADLSMLKYLSDHGAVFRENGSAPSDVYAFFHSAFPCARLRLFVNPTGEEAMCTDLDYVAEMAAKFHDAGGSVLLDFHYSDTWADPAKQLTPEAWRSFPFEEVEEAVYRHTREAVERIRPGSVQIGNEVTPGMLWEYGRVMDPFDTGSRAEWKEDDAAAWMRFTRLLKSGIRGAKEAMPETEIMIHIDQGGNREICRHFFDRLREHGVGYDTIGLSYYPFWHGSLEELDENMTALGKRFGKNVTVVETAYPYRGPHRFYEEREEPDAAWNAIRRRFPVSPEGQKEFCETLLRLCRDNPYCTGLFYWAPEWFPRAEPPERDSARQRSLFDENGNTLPAFDVWKIQKQM